jgi:hypothetical protein
MPKLTLEPDLTGGANQKKIVKKKKTYKINLINN